MAFGSRGGEPLARVVQGDLGIANHELDDVSESEDPPLRYQEPPGRFECGLTEHGRELFLVLMALMQ